MEKKRKIKMLKLLSWVMAIIFAIVVGLLITALADASYKWSQAGRAPLMPEVQDKISLQEQFSLYKMEIIDGLKMAEPAWDASRVFDISESLIRSDINVEEVAFPGGQKFFWMIFKGKKGISILRDVEWTGKEPILGFLYSCVYEGLEIKFFLPKKCGNIALLEKKILPLPPKKESPRVQAPPPSPPPAEPPPEVKVYVYYPPPPRVETPPLPRYSDLCANIEGLQTRVPEGMVQDGYGSCIQPRTEQPPVNNYYYYQQEQEQSPPPAVSYFPLLPPPFLHYRDNFYRDDFPRDYYPRRDYQPRQHYHPRQHYQQRVRPPTVHTRPPAQQQVRPPGVRTR